MKVRGDKVKVNLTVNTGPIEVGGYRVVTEHYNNSYLPPIVRARPGDAVAAQLVNLLAPRDRACEHEKAHKALCEPCEHEKAHKLCEPCEHEKAHKSCENPTNLHYFHGGIVSPQNSRRYNIDAGAGKGPDNVTGDNVYVHLANGVDADGKARRFNFNVPIPGEGELDARVLEGEGMIAHPPGLNWYHSHLHGISSDQVMGGMSGLLSVGEDDANVKAACKNPIKDKCDNDVTWGTAELKWKTDVRYALLRDIMLRDITEVPESANGASAIWAPELRDFKPRGDVLNPVPRECPVWRKGSSKAENDAKLRKGYCQPQQDQAWLFTLNGQRFPTITVGGNRNLLLRLGNLSANVAYWLELYNEKNEKTKKLTILALDGVVPARPVLADDAAKPVDAIKDDSLLLMPASRAEIYVRNDDELHDDEQVYILRTKGLNAGTDWWPEIQLARIVLKLNQVESPYLVGLNAPIETVREEVVRELEAVSEEEKVPEPPPGCVRDLDPSKKEHRRVTFSGEKDPELKTDWKVETEQTCPEPPETCPDGSQTCQCPEPNQKLYINDIVDPKYFKCPDPEKPAAIEDDKPSDREWHDTIPMPPNETVFLIMSFDDKEQLGRFVFHCHILKHEDKGLMAPIEVWDTGDLKTKEASTPGR